MKRKFLITLASVFATAIVFNANFLANAAPDDQGPVVSNFQISRTSIDSGSSSRSITFSFGASDVTGINYVNVNFCSNYEFLVRASAQGPVVEGGSSPTGNLSVQATSAAGNVQAFTISVTTSINANALPQTCNVTTYSNDTLGNRTGNVPQGNFRVTRSQLLTTPPPSPTPSPLPSVSPSPRPSPSPSVSSSPPPSSSPISPTQPGSQTYQASTLFTASSSKILPSTTKTITSLVKTSKNWSVATITTSFSNSKSTANQKAIKLEEQRVASLKSLLIKSGLKASQIKVVKKSNSKITKPQTNLSLR